MERRIRATGYVWRVFFFLAGQFLCGCAVVLSVNAGLGVLPGSSLAYALSLVTGLDMGRCTFLIFAALLLVQALLLRWDFHARDLLQLMGALLFSGSVSAGTMLLAFWKPVSYPARLLELAVGLVVFAFGIALYIDTDVLTNVPERTVLALGRRTGLSVGTAKILLDCTMVGLAVLLTLAGCGRVTGVREGTVAAALGVGWMMGAMHRKMAPGLHRLCFGLKASEERLV